MPWLLLYGFPTRGPPICIVRPASIYVNCEYTTEFTEYFRRLGVPITAIFSRAAREPAQNNGRGPLP